MNMSIKRHLLSFNPIHYKNKIILNRNHNKLIENINKITFIHRLLKFLNYNYKNNYLMPCRLYIAHSRSSMNWVEWWKLFMLKRFNAHSYDYINLSMNREKKYNIFIIFHEETFELLIMSPGFCRVSFLKLLQFFNTWRKQQCLQGEAHDTIIIGNK